MTSIERRCENAGERLVLQALRRHLEDDYIVWYRVPIMGSGREPDFVILHPGRGLLILEVKHWRRSTLRPESNTIRVTLATEAGETYEKHPLIQAREYAEDLARALGRRPELRHAGGPHLGHLILPWGYGAVLSNIRRKEVAGDPSFDLVFVPERTLLRDDLDDENLPAMDFQARLWGMFKVAWQADLTLPQQDLVRGVMLPELQIGYQSELALDASPSRLVVRDVLQVMDLQQELVARSLGEGHRVVHGPAGSGKTMILVFRAMQLQTAARPDRPILVLCYSTQLAARIETMLRLKGAGAAIQVRTFHSWAYDLVKTYQLAPVGSRSQFGNEDYDAIAALACEGIGSARVPKGQYTALLIDEAHDLREEWLAAAAQMVDPSTRSLLVLYDEAQSIFRKERRKLNFAKLGIDARGRTQVLKINYRNTAEVLAVALECAGGLLQERHGSDDEDVPLVMPQSAGRHGPMPTLHRHGSGRAEADFVISSIQDLAAQGKPLSEIAVLARSWNGLELIHAALGEAGLARNPLRPGKAESRSAEPRIRLLTMHGVKGLEFDTVFIVGLDRLSDRQGDMYEELRLLYVAMTRATQRLAMCAVGDTVLVRHIDAAVHRVAAVD